jgi:hypothetical protein
MVAGVLSFHATVLPAVGVKCAALKSDDIVVLGTAEDLSLVLRVYLPLDLFLVFSRLKTFESDLERKAAPLDFGDHVLASGFTDVLIAHSYNDIIDLERQGGVVYCTHRNTSVP